MKKYVFVFVAIAFFSLHIKVQANEFLYENGNVDAFNLINIEEMWENGFTGKGVTIAVIDTGLEIQSNNFLHEEFVDENIIQKDCRIGNCETIQDGEEESINWRHGTNVIGLIASKHDGMGVKGIAPNAKIVSYIVNEPSLTNDDVNKALIDIYNRNSDTSKQKIDIVNISRSLKESAETTELLRKLHYEQGVLIVAAGGNGEIILVVENVVSPAKLDFVIGVANVNNGGVRHKGDSLLLSGSNVGKGIDLASPGVNLWTTTLNSEYSSETGTSFSAPIVSGYLALLKEQFPNDSAQELRRKLLVNTVPRPGKTSSDSNIPGNLEYGNGILQAIPYGKKFSIPVTLNTKFYMIPYDSNEYLVTNNLPPTNAPLDVYLEWDDALTKATDEDSTVWLKVKINEDTYYWMKKDDENEDEIGNNPIAPRYLEDAQNKSNYYYSKTGSSSFQDRIYWRQKDTYKSLSYSTIEEKFDYYPNRDAYETFRSMATGAFYDSELFKSEREELFKHYKLTSSLKENGDHPYKDIIDYLRIDSMNHYNLVLEDKLGQTYFVPIWSHAPLEFNLEDQTIKTTNTSFVHVDGHMSDWFQLYGLSPKNSFVDLHPLYGLNSYVASKSRTDYGNYNYLSSIQSFLGTTNLQLISY